MYTFDKSLTFAKDNLDGDWDVITLQASSYYARLGNMEMAKSDNLPYAEKLYEVIREACPDAKLYWHQTWAFEIGYGTANSDPNDRVETLEKRSLMHSIKKELAQAVAKAENVDIIPSGDAWQIARKSELIGQTLCARKGVNNNLGDYSHDGDIGGGQYLNACVWYEVLFGKSCIGNTYRPNNYELSEEKIEILQRAAHEAVAAVYGADYAK